MEKPDSAPRLLLTSLLFLLASSLAKRPRPMALPMPTTANKPVAAVVERRVVVPMVAPAALVVVARISMVAKAGAARARATMRTLIMVTLRFGFD